MIASVLLAVLVVIGLYVASHRLGGVQATIALAILGLGIVLVIFPGLASATANRLNVGRGTDLLLYFAVISGLFIAAHFYFRFKRQEVTVTNIVRFLALQDLDVNVGPLNETTKSQAFKELVGGNRGG